MFYAKPVCGSLAEGLNVLQACWVIWDRSLGFRVKPINQSGKGEGFHRQDASGWSH